MNATITVDLWSDIACPWCYIGKHRFAEGLAAFEARRPDVEVSVRGRSYELAPDTPEDFSGGEVEFLVGHKGMAREQVEGMLAQMTELGAGEGIAFDFARVRHVNTRRAHRLLHLAAEQGLQSDLQERLFAAYFGEGADLSSGDVLVALAAEVGLDREAASAALEDRAYAQAVDADLAEARAIGVTGVPFFLLNGRYAVSGAQPADTFAQLLERVLELDGGDGAHRDARTGHPASVD